MSYTLYCYILLEKGKLAKLNVRPEQQLLDIRMAIYEEKEALFKYYNLLDDGDLQLYKPENLRRTRELDGQPLPQRARDSISTLSSLEVDESVDNISRIFGDELLNGNGDLIHLVVVPMRDSESRELFHLNGLICPREATVSGIWDRLLNYRFVWARGTPGSGKSILAKLLVRHVMKSSPEAKVISFGVWTSTSMQSRTWRDVFVDRGWKEGDMTVFVFDEAQMSYKDSELWNTFFKNLADFNKVYAIGFASYGSPLSRFEVGDEDGDGGIPMNILSKQRITLRPIDHNDGRPAVGILFTKEEFDDAVVRRYTPEGGHHFDQTFLDGLFRITGGHIGAIVDVLQIIEIDDSYRGIKQSDSDSLFKWDTFLTSFPPPIFIEQIENSASVFKRGLPYDLDLQDTAISTALSIVAQKTTVKANGVAEATLKKCARRGWLHTDSIIGGKEETFIYFFASSLHQWYVEWKLFVDRAPKEPSETSLIEFVLAVIRKFNPQIFQEEGRIGAACVQRPPEAQFQDEFYRCSHVHSGGSLVTFPEFGISNGRVDFYVPSKRWGIELLREGDNLEEHLMPFSRQPGTYHGIFSLKDYIILDCRTTRPLKKYPGFGRLYHAVFENGYQEVTILDNRNQIIEKFYRPRQ